MFLGEYQHSLDAKGRLIIPSKFRSALGEHFVVTKGLDNCLFVYPKKEWEIFEENLKRLPLTNEVARKFTRFFFSGAAECELDGQGRISLPQALRKYAKLEKEVVSIGVNNRVEIWCKEAWDAYADEENFITNEFAAELEGLGI